MSDRNEAALLLAILGERWRESVEIARAAAIDPDAFVEICRTCDIHPRVHDLLEREDRWEITGTAARERLSAMKRKCRSDNILLLGVTEQVLDLLMAEGIVPVALKGFDFLHRFYSMFDQRLLDDVDLLVHPGQVERTLAILEKAGFSVPTGEERTHWLRSSYEIPLQSPGPVPVSVEIHWGLGQEKRYGLSIEPVLERAVPMEVEGRIIRRLDDHDAAAHLLLHHLQHFFDRRLKWIIDFGSIIREPGFEWGRLAGRLKEWGGLAAAGMSLVHIRKLFPDLVPETGFRILPVAMWRRIMTLPLRSGHPLDLFRSTRNRKVQLYLAAAMIEQPSKLPGYLLHRARRDRTEGAGIVEREGASPAGKDRIRNDDRP